MYMMLAATPQPDAPASRLRRTTTCMNHYLHSTSAQSGRLPCCSHPLLQATQRDETASAADMLLAPQPLLLLTADARL
jgi:hypothetical protein